MDDPVLKLKNAPIIEAILNIECDMPPTQKIEALKEPARKAFCPQYPTIRAMMLQEHQIDTKPEMPPKVSTQQRLQGLQFLQEDERQLVQLRSSGFSFNRLAPYSSLDDYLPEMARTWKIFTEIALPVQLRFVQLRFINRILIPMAQGKVELEDYLKISPRLPDEERLGLIGFFNQHTAFEKETNDQINIVLASQAVEDGKLPIIFDIAAGRQLSLEPQNWSAIAAVVNSLRKLKNDVFRKTLTNECLNLFQH